LEEMRGEWSSGGGGGVQGKDRIEIQKEKTTK